MRPEAGNAESGGSMACDYREKIVTAREACADFCGNGRGHSFERAAAGSSERLIGCARVAGILTVGGPEGFRKYTLKNSRICVKS